MARIRNPSNLAAFTEYYKNQALGNNPHVFSGPLVQRGHGLGGIFSSIFRTVAPVFRGVVAPLIKRGAKAAAKEAVTAGAQIATDALAGKSLGAAVKQRSEQAVNRLVQQGHRNVVRMLNAPKPRKVPQKRIKGPKNRKTATRTKRSTDSDVFGRY